MSDEYFQLPVVAAPQVIDPVQFTQHLREEGFDSFIDALYFAQEEYSMTPRNLETVLMYNHRNELEHISFLILSGNGRRAALYRDPQDRLYHLSSYRKNSEIPPGTWGFGGD